MTPLVMLDVDGVLNALGDLDCWPDEQNGFARAEGNLYPITFSRLVVARLRNWHESGAAEVQWLTTWGHDANAGLRELLGMPELVVAGTYDDEGVTAEVDVTSHAASAPSAPDPLSGRWWKYDVVQRVLREQPGRTVVWIDDELSNDSRFRRWGETQEHHLTCLGPDPMTGLSPTDLKTLSRLLEDT